MSASLTPTDVADLFRGSQLGVLSAASTYPGAWEQWVMELASAHGDIELVPPSEAEGRFPDGELACCVGAMGSLAAMYETPMNGDEPEVAVRALESVLGDRVRAIAPLNVAGPNGLMAVATACLLDLPLLDCDGQGRVLPLIDQTTYALGGISPAPLVGVGPWGDVLTLQAHRSRAERVARSALVGAGGWLATALYPAPAERLAASGIPGSVSRTVAAGRILGGGRGGLATRLAQEIGGRILGRGRVTEIAQDSDRPTSDQPAQPVRIMLTRESPSLAEILLEVRNEVVLALVDGAVVARAPEAICLLDPLRRRTVDLLDLQVGDVVDVLLLPADDRWHSPQGLQMAGPAAYGAALMENA